MEGTTHNNQNNYQMDIFTRNSTIFGVVVIFIILFKFLIQNLYIFLIIILYSALYYIIEAKVSGVIKSIIVSDQYFGFVPRFLLKQFAFSIMLCAGIWVWFWKIKQEDYLSVYLHAYMYSTTVFLIYLAVRALLMGLGMISRESLRLGIMGIIQRIVIVIKGNGTMIIWLKFLNTRKKNKIFILLIYSLTKLIIFIYTLVDLFSAINIYRNNYKTRIKISKPLKKHLCTICLNKGIKEPVHLKCGHIFCYHCLVRWLMLKARCPYCYQPTFSPPTVIELSDSFVPFSVFISAF